MKYLLILVILLLLLFFLPIKTSWSAPKEPKVEMIEVKEVTVTKPTIKEYAKERVLKVFGEGQWEAFNWIIAKESHNWTVTGPHYPSGYAKIKQKDGTYKYVKSSAWGLCGTLINTHKVEKGFKDDVYKQIDWCIEYTKTYGNPQKAKKAHLQKGHW